MTIFLVSFLSVSILISILLAFKLKSAKNNGNGGLFLSNKTLRHLARSCENHIDTCNNRDENLIAMLNFSKELMNSDVISSGNKLVQNMEIQLSKAQDKYNGLAKLVEEVLNNQNLSFKLKNSCLCGSMSFCQRHGRATQTKL